MARSRVKYLSNVPAIRAILHHRAEQLVDDTGQRLVEETKARAPRSDINEPGYVHLADSYEWAGLDGTRGAMTTDLAHAPYQEFGTVHQSGTPHVGPAAIAVAPEFREGLGHLFDG